MYLVTSLLVCLASAQTPPAPTELVVRAATSSRTELIWTAPPGSFLVERRALDGEYATLATVTAAIVIDDKLDPMETYQYRVRATLPSGNSDPSNEVTVGPPPVGFTPPCRCPMHSPGMTATRPASARTPT